MSIENFIKMHSPLATNVLLSDVLFWTKAQASFLCDEISNDADWAEMSNQLNAKLHSKD
jgi:hypothetical protein